jgi:hypothetical protein
MAENDIAAGLRAMTGVALVDGATVVVVVGVGVSIWLSPGIAVDSFCIPRPLDELPPWLDELGAATPDREEKLDDVDVVGLENALPTDSDVVVVVVDVFAGAVPTVVEFTTVESLLWVVEVSEIVGAFREVESVRDVLAPSVCTVANGCDFLMSLCDLRAGAESFPVERDFAVVRSVRWARF